jgi:hypothetical protein
MGKWAICDVCGHKDDCNTGNGPLLDGGAKLVVWNDDSQTNDESEGFTLDLCTECKADLILKHAGIAKALKEKGYE